MKNCNLRSNDFQQKSPKTVNLFQFAFFFFKDNSFLFLPLLWIMQFMEMLDEYSDADCLCKFAEWIQMFHYLESERRWQTQSFSHKRRIHADRFTSRDQDRITCSQILYHLLHSYCCRCWSHVTVSDLVVVVVVAFF